MKKEALIVTDWLQFWELDIDHDFMIDREDLLRYGNHGLTYRIVDRIFSGAPRPLTCTTPGKMGYEDFVYFILSEEDKTTDASLAYWHHCIDLDADGVINVHDMRSAPVPFFSKLNKMFFGYFDPENILLDNENK